MISALLSRRRGLSFRAGPKAVISDVPVGHTVLGFGKFADGSAGMYEIVFHQDYLPDANLLIANSSILLFTELYPDGWEAEYDECYEKLAKRNARP